MNILIRYTESVLTSNRYTTLAIAYRHRVEYMYAAIKKETLPARTVVFAQISESRLGRCVRTPEYLYSVYAPGVNGGAAADSTVYADDFLYDLRKDPYQLDNVIENPEYSEVRAAMAELLIEQMKKAGENSPRILHANA